MNIEIENNSSIDLEIGSSKGIDYEIGKNKNATSYNHLTDKPSINGIELIGNKTTEELGIVGTSMTEIELSTDISNPTNILDYINVSGTYVAKNKGVLGYNGEPITALGKGQFFKVLNLKDLYLITGEELPDEENLIRVDIPMMEGSNKIYFMFGNGEILEGYEINSLNINDYVDIDTSNFLTKNMFNSNYGIKFQSNYLMVQQASNAEINTGTNTYKPITPSTGDYLVKTKGANYFADKTEFNNLQVEVETLNDNLTNLKGEIETILDSVVSV